MPLTRTCGRYIGFLGPDGSGKTTIIRSVAAELQRRGVNVERYHWRVRWAGPVAGESTISHPDPHGADPRGHLGSFLQLGWWWTTAWAAWLRRIPFALQRGTWVLIDRGALDAVVDPRRYRNRSPLALRRCWAATQPGPDLWIVLTAEAEVLYTRKPEVPLSDLRDLVFGYRRLSGPHIRHIAVDREVGQVMADVLDALDLRS